MQINIFVSYTLRDNLLSKTKLNNFKNALKMLKFLTTYIDILDNNNTISPQNEVIDKLIKSDIVWLIHSSDEIFKSKWVLKEIQIAKENNKIIHYLDIGIIDNIIYAKNDFILLRLINNYFFHNTINEKKILIKI
jgi:hypothetical protein